MIQRPPSFGFSLESPDPQFERNHLPSEHTRKTPRGGEKSIKLVESDAITDQGLSAARREAVNSLGRSFEYDNWCFVCQEAKVCWLSNPDHQCLNFAKEIKMPIEMPQGLPFSVDTWTPSSKQKRHHFLTHAHRDHTTGITTHCSFPIYCTRLTRDIVLQHFPQLYESLFICIEVGQMVVVKDPDGAFTVTVFDAYHCPGAVMFLFEGNFGNILHTGDCRLTPECLQNLPQKYRGKGGKEPRCPLDLVFLDCTFGRFFQQFPSKHSSIHQVINCIWEHPDAPVVYLSCDLLGQEEILRRVSQTFGSKIFVNESIREGFKALGLTAPDILSQDPSSRFHLLEGFPKLHQRAKLMLAEAQTNFHHKPLVIRPSAQWYVRDESSEVGNTRKQIISQAIRDQFGIWHVCYSMHSSKDELEWALQVFAPKWVVSTTPGCRAMDLDYVKKHPICSRVTPNCLIWKLLGMAEATFTDSDASMVELDCSSIVEVSNDINEEPQIQPMKISVVPKEMLNLLPSSNLLPVTLFGRARLAAENIDLLQELEAPCPENEPVQEVRDKAAELFIRNENGISMDVSFKYTENEVDSRTKPETFASNDGLLACDIASLCSEQVRLSVSEVKLGFVEDGTTEAVCSKEEEVQMLERESKGKDENLLGEREDQDVRSGSKGYCEKLVDYRMTVSNNCHVLSVGCSKGFNDKFRKLYRSMNVAVPEPLPSLMELMKSRKRAKKHVSF